MCWPITMTFRDFHCNLGMVELERVESDENISELFELIEMHHRLTGSTVAESLLTDWPAALDRFVKVMPTDYKRVLEERAEHDEEGGSPRAQRTRPIKNNVDQAEIPWVNLPDSKSILANRFPTADPRERASDFLEVFSEPQEHLLKNQGARCMDCGVPFCQSDSGCPIDNLIPEWNDLVYQGRWRDALDRLHKTNNFPEFTGRTCPAPCEGACVLGIIEPPVTIKNIENAIIDRGWAEEWITPHPPAHRTGRQVAIVGSGPAGLAAAAQLNSAGHSVTVYERADRMGGLLMYGIPNMKLDKKVVLRRINLLREEGVKFVTSAHVGREEDFSPGHMTQIMQTGVCPVRFIDPQQLLEEYDAVLLATGATRPFDPVARCPGRDLQGIHFAMDFLTRNTKSLLDSRLQDGQFISARDKHVIVIGGGDTGADCIGTSLRHECRVCCELRTARPTSRRASAG